VYRRGRQLNVRWAGRVTDDELLELFGYTRDWIAAGVIDSAGLRRQYASFEGSDDKNSEHYRNGVFLEYLRSTSRLTDTELDLVLALTDVGADLRINRSIQLISSGLLSDEQFDRLAATPAVQDGAAARVYSRHGLLRLLARTGLTAATFALIEASPDSFVHEAVLRHPQVSREHLLWLGEAGANRSIRNRALAALKSNRYRS
jgi:hypothetical protein